ncbi:putative ATPase/class 3 adenylate cyclase [Mycobacterium sp. OAS707]|uniref:NB-ARC domain-containing protein n=1 Tax=Mycobacterium sp. OAS707 TaxID=2663822 RepID=UPI00178A0254|nr:NB-ARC domain-containing protein [Mycobacterium sp. OAS707]MBE1550492.1 putative ATPase/class 3 adenylate cyclase [Mycobacterium sp. OAS707]
MTAQPPSGTVTFLLTDLEGSTRMWEQEPDAMKAAMVRHDEILEKAFAANRGFVFARMGDGMAVAFATAGDAICAAIAIKQALTEENWRTATPLKARIGVHTAEAVIVDDTGYASLPINRCSRLMSSAHGGQIVLSNTTESLVGDALPDDVELTDLGEHRLRDLGRPLRIFQIGREEFPPIRGLDSFPGNLPAQVSSFIGRQTEVSRVASALGESRVVTITGVGGVGKTRLAIQVAADLLPRYREGVWLVELASVTEQSSVVEVISDVFHAASRSGQSLEDSLIETLSRKQVLVILDNCEHLLGSVSRLVTRIEESCPGVVVLATSREGMAIEGEQLIALPPLGTGAPGDDIDQLIHTEAASLFIERARRVKSDFTLTQDNAHAAVEICRRLDGVPLAIELAAARVIALSPNEILRRLDRRFDLLAGGRRGAVGRHATLRAAIDWSYELLDYSEQRLLARLSVFASGCTLEAIEEVCSGDPVERDAALDLITALVTRSLVIVEDHAAGTRYRLLETIRQYAEQKLAEFGETQTVRTRHSRFYADLCLGTTRGHFRKLAVDSEVSWTGRIGVERDNIRSGLANAIDAGDVEDAVLIVANHPHRDRAQAGRTGQVFSVPASRVIQMPGATTHPEYPRALMVASYEALDSGDYARADQLCQQALEAASRMPTPVEGPPIALDALTVRAEEAMGAGEYDDAVAAYVHAAQLAESSGYQGIAAIHLAYSVTSALLGNGDPEAALGRAEKSLALARQNEMSGAIVIALNALALALVEHDPEQARTLLHESVERSITPGEEIAPAFVTAALVAGRLHDWRLTLALAGRAMYMFRGIMNPLHAAPCLTGCARALGEDQPEAAGLLNGAAFATFRSADPTTHTARRADKQPFGTSTNFLLQMLRETSDIVTAAVGDARARELRRTGAAMGLDEAVSFALANVDPKLLTGPIANIER